MSLLRILILGLLCAPSAAAAQRIAGRLALPTSASPAFLYLLGTRGTEHFPIDSARTDQQGRFHFQARRYPTGFYQLALHDTDRVDLILDGVEPELVLEFSGLPLREHILVKRSMENQLLWEYKAISRANRSRLASLAAERRSLAITDIAGARKLDSLEGAVMLRRKEELERLAALAPQSYFSKITALDAALEDAASRGPQAILEAIDLSDPALLRSAFYPKVLVTFVQSLHPADEAALFEAVDALVLATSRDDECHQYTIAFLLEVFLTNGHDLGFTHVVDKYVAGATMPLPAELMQRVQEQLRVSPGEKAASVVWPGAGNERLRSDSLYHSSEHTLMLFYSSTCGHCHELIREIKERHTDLVAKQVQVFGVALDENEQEFKQALQELAPPWPCVSEFKGWAAPSARAYQVRALPTMYLIDRAGVIAAKPMDVRDLEEFLGRGAQDDHNGKTR